MSAPASRRWVAKLCRRVWGLGKTCDREVLLEQPGDAANRQPPPEFVGEQRPARRCPRGDRVWPGRQPGPQSAAGMGPHDAQPLAAALAADPRRAVSKIEIAVIEAHQLADADTGGIHEFEDRAVADTTGRIGAGGGQQAGDLVTGEKLRQFAGPARAAKRLGGVGPHPALALAKGIEAPQTGELAGHRR